MNPIDGCFLGTFFISGLVACIRGLTREILGLLSWTGAAVLALFSLPAVRHIARAYIKNPLFADALTLLLTFLALLISFSILSHVFSNYVKESGIGGLDRVLGLAFGVFRAAILLGLIDIFLSILVGRDHYPPSVQNAKFTPVIIHFSNGLKTLVPQSLLDTLHSYAAQQKPIPSNSQPTTPGISSDSSEKEPSASSNPQSPTPEKALLSAEQAVNALAKLTPKATKPSAEDHKDEGYAPDQRSDMNRLLQTTQ